MQTSQKNDETRVHIFSMKVPTDENTFLVGQFNAEVLKNVSACCVLKTLSNFMPL